MGEECGNERSRIENRVFILFFPMAIDIKLMMQNMVERGSKSETDQTARI